MSRRKKRSALQEWKAVKKRHRQGAWILSGQQDRLLCAGS